MPNLIKYTGIMILLIPSAILFLAAFALLLTKLQRVFPENSLETIRKASRTLHLPLRAPKSQTAWLAAFVGAALGFGGILFLQTQLPLLFSFLAASAPEAFAHPLVFFADDMSWLYALSLAALLFGAALTALSEEDFFDASACSLVLVVAALGILAVFAGTPFTLAVLWATLDLIELLTRMRAVHTPKLRERAILAFSARLLGVGVLLWAWIVGVAEHRSFNFSAVPPELGLLILLAASIRLGVIPFHLPFPYPSSQKRIYAVILEMSSAASSLILFARTPRGGIESPYLPLMFALAGFTAFYSAWKWLRLQKLEDARAYWILGIGALSLTAALRANPEGSAAWGAFLLLGGGALFLTLKENLWLKRLLLASLIGGVSLPFSLTATTWLGRRAGIGVFWTLFLIPQTWLLAGYVRYALRSAAPPFDGQRREAQWMSLLGGAVFPLVILLTGVWGWAGARQIGNWGASLAALILAALLLWRRIHLLSRIQSIQPKQKLRWERVYQAGWSLYLFLGKLSEMVSTVLESDGGILWTMLFLVLFVSLVAGGAAK